MTTHNARFQSGMRSFVTDLLDVEVVRDERDVVDEPDVAVVFVRGELDRTGVPWLAGCLREVLNRGGPGGSVVLNLTGVTFVDVGGVRLLTEATDLGAVSVRAYARRQEVDVPTFLAGRRPSAGPEQVAQAVLHLATTVGLDRPAYLIEAGGTLAEVS